MRSHSSMGASTAGPREHHPGVVDDHIEAAERPYRSGDRLLCRGSVRHVRLSYLRRATRAADSLCRGVEAVAASGNDRYRRSFGGERSGGGLTDARVGPGDQRHRPLQAICQAPLLPKDRGRPACDGTHRGATMGAVEGSDVAVACCRRSEDAEPDDLYPDPDATPLRAALVALGASSSLVSWDDPRVDWASFAKVFVSSTWDSVDRPDEYLAWARRVSKISDLVNPVTVLEWDLDKVSQRDLAAAGVPVVPTTWVAPGDHWNAPPPGSEFVVKPSVSAGGRNTARYAGGDATAVAHVNALQRGGQTVMIQDYLSTIDTEGETDLIFVGGRFSHAVLKKPLLKEGQGILARPWEHMAWFGLAEPSTEQLSVALRTMEAASTRLGQYLAYGRVDLVNDSSGDPLVLEVELIDPYLSLDANPSAATGLATILTYLIRR